MYLGTYMILCGIFILRRYESTKVSKFLWTIYLRVFNQIIPRILKKKQIKNDKFLKVAPKNLKNSYPRHKIEKERDHRFYWKHQKIIENYVRCNNIWISAANCAVSGADSPWRSSAAETIAPS